MHTCNSTCRLRSDTNDSECSVWKIRDIAFHSCFEQSDESETFGVLLFCSYFSRLEWRQSDKKELLFLLKYRARGLGKAKAVGSRSKTLIHALRHRI